MADSMTYASPEVKKGGWSSVKEFVLPASPLNFTFKSLIP